MKRKICCRITFIRGQKLFVLSFFSIFLSLVTSIPVASQDLGKGFFDHGVAVPISNHRGAVATVDGNGRNVLLVWLFDHRGTYALLMVDAETGKSEQFSMPFPTAGESVNSSILSSKNKFYTLFNKHFAEFDPVNRAFTFNKETIPLNAMGMTEDDQGVIWAVTYPNSGLVSFNPNTHEIKAFGYINKENWPQYPYFLATDNAGWIYFGIGITASQIIAFDPVTRQAKTMLNETDRKHAYAYVYRDMDGKVYGQSMQSSKEDWYEFYKGNGLKISKHNPLNPKPIISGTPLMFHSDFPDGKKIKKLDLSERKLIVEDTITNTEKVVSFEYTSEGAMVIGVGTSPDGTIAGGTAFPFCFFDFNPKTGKTINREAFGQFNALTRQGDRFYFGVYHQGALLEWNPSKPWINTNEGIKTNPLFLADADLFIRRPLRLLAYSDGKTIIMSGTPEYGYTGGGLLFWDRKKRTQTLLKDSAIILNQSTMSLVALPGGKLLGGSTTIPGTGGEKKATEAELYIMDMVSKRVEWHKVLMPGVQSYSDMCIGSDGLVYGITDFKKFFVFDPVKRLVIHQEDAAASFGGTVTNQQSPRIFVLGPKKEIYLLFVKGIVRVEPGSFKMTMIAESPVPIDIGGDYLNGRIYFSSGGHIYSYKL